MTSLFSYEGHQFNLDGRYNVNGNQRYRCLYFDSVRRCPVKLWRLTNGRMLQIGQHNHIVHQIQPDQPPERRPAPRVRNTNRRQPARRQSLPPTPSTFEELEEILLVLRAADDIYQGHVKDNSSMAYIFSTDRSLKLLSESSEWHINICFQCAPLMPQCSFLLTILVRRENLGVPVFFALCNENTSKLFGLIWAWILEKVPDTRNNLKYTISDVDRSLLSSIKLWLPFAERNGSWINAARALADKWRSLQLPNRDKPLSIILNSSWAISFVPEEKLNEAIDILANMLDAHDNGTQNFTQFRQFLVREYLPVANYLSIWGKPWKAASFTETYYNKLLHHFGEEHPTIFHLIPKLSTLIGTEVNSSWTPRARRSNSDHYVFETATVLSSRLHGGQCSLLDYLKIIGFTRKEIRTTLDVAVDRQRYLYQNLAQFEHRLDLLGSRNFVNRAPEPEPAEVEDELVETEDQPAAVEDEPIEIEEDRPEEIEDQPAEPRSENDDDNIYYRGEIQLLDEPEQLPWINSSTQGMEFNDEEADDFVLACVACRINRPKAAFSPCGHSCLCLECNLSNADNIRSHTSRQVIHRQRPRYRPPIPQNFKDLGETLTVYRMVSNIYQHEVIAEDGSIAQIFGSNNMLQRLGESSTLLNLEEASR
ncbi:Protein of unknown function [Cotesia congregata]|uniref:Uncharacterized protein n=1 Tax=Cotesia congregata TaxID=51543 RepID=A0A8J2H6D3_COTCN|nr:Protein of unknown function [Cotesia congregata]